MAFTTLSLGLTLQIPTAGTTNWATTVYNGTWIKISQHKHTGGGDGNQLITASYADNSVTGVKLAKNIYNTQASVLTPAGTAQTIDWSTGNIQQLNLGSATGTVFVTLANPAAGARYRIYITNGASPQDISWPAGFMWAQGVKVPLTDASGKARVYAYYDGTNYWGEWEILFS